MARGVPGEFFEFMTPYPRHIVDTMLAAREAVLNAAPSCTEMLYDATYAVALGYTYTHSHVQGFIHIAAYSRYANLGFNYGSELDDPERRLIGKGSRVRHVSLGAPAQVEDAYVLRLIGQAERQAIRPPEPLEALQIVRTMRGAKHRPA